MRRARQTSVGNVGDQNGNATHQCRDRTNGRAGKITWSVTTEPDRVAEPVTPLRRRPAFARQIINNVGSIHVWLRTGPRRGERLYGVLRSSRNRSGSPSPP